MPDATAMLNTAVDVPAVRLVGVIVDVELLTERAPAGLDSDEDILKSQRPAKLVALEPAATV